MKDIKRLFKYLQAHRSKLGLSILCNILTAVFTVISIPLIMPFFQILFAGKGNQIENTATGFEFHLRAFFIDLIEKYEAPKALLVICIMIMLAFLFKNLFRYLALFFMGPVRSGIMYDLRQELFNKYLYLAPKQLQQNKKGDLLSRISSDVQEVEWSILQFLQTLVQSPLIIIGSLAFMLIINLKLSLIVFGLMLVIGFVIGNISKTLKKNSSELQSNLGKLVTTTEQGLDGLLSIDVFDTRSDWNTRFDDSNKAHRNSYIQLLRRRDLSSPLSEFLGIGVVVVLLWVGARMVFANDIAPDTFFAFILAFYFVIEPSKSFATAFYNLKKGIAALDRIEAIDPEATMNTHSTKVGTIAFDKDITFENLSFQFSDASQPTLDKINLSFKKGTVNALVGASGAGKTSLVYLLLKIYKPTSGRILIDGVDLQEIDTAAWRKQIGFVPQESFIYDGTIADNILFGRKISEERIEQLISDNSAFQFIEDKSNGISTQVSGKGSSLSGGERQRITIARALVGAPSLLILDEPTSALDADSEHELSQAILEVTQHQSSIIIAHRLSTIKHADNIVVLEKGSLVEQGNHEELIKNNHIYQRYIKLQSF